MFAIEALTTGCWLLLVPCGLLVSRLPWTYSLLLTVIRVIKEFQAFNNNTTIIFKICHALVRMMKLAREQTMHHQYKDNLENQHARLNIQQKPVKIQASKTQTSDLRTEGCQNRNFRYYQWRRDADGSAHHLFKNKIWFIHDSQNIQLSPV